MVSVLALILCGGNFCYGTRRKFAVYAMYAGRISDKVGRKFRVEVMFITASQVICRVVDEKADKNEKDYENFDDVVVSDDKRKDLSDR